MKIAEMNNCIEKMTEIYKAIADIRAFLILLMYKIKFMSEKDFNKLLSNRELTYEQKIYLIYFRCV